MRITKPLIPLLKKQLENNFLLGSEESKLIDEVLDSVLQRVDQCFRRCKNKYYYQGGEVVFNPYHLGQYSVFLYFLSNMVWKRFGTGLADKIYCLNRMISSCDLFYQVELPEVFYMEHPVGSVIGRGKIGNFFCFQQNCTVGGNKGIYPTLGNGVWLFAGATVIGNSKIGNNVFVSAHSYVKDEIIPDNTIVFGKSPNLILKQKEPSWFESRSAFILD
ncbi:hypothetical protein KDU71_17575 [Carboxylicivirga sediminis]|uniref:Transferase n=1 Tax=Carboxylicivirga sediminis TaxID=2006564 RepID=A0A941F6F2_9BACT|nr:hypothetical protein [Carboxylicivirga sediminis]MBR8537382.1 hypothetical protein [Carboxylicivirga sediminis]